MHPLIIVQQVDEREWLLSFIVQWIRALAARVDRLDVIALQMGQATLPDNVFVQSMGKEKGYSRARELWEFNRAMRRTIRHVDVVFSHMAPRYAWLAAPYAGLYHKPQMLWFTHRQASLELRLALAASRYVMTATQDSFPINSPKVQVMGHGIDTALFSPGDPPPDDPPLVLAVGRVSPIKHHHILLEAAALLRDQFGDPPVRFAVVGAAAAPGDEAYQNRLIRRRAELGLGEDRFMLMGQRPTADLIPLYRRASVVTNLSPAGLFDKAALEGMLCGTPLVAASPAFDAVLGEYRDQLRVSGPEDSASVAARIAGLLKLSPPERAAIGLYLRERTAAEHSLDRLMDRIVGLMREVAVHA
jgi:glycosyltransferase involved in cell wall biosynthesis